MSVLTPLDIAEEILRELRDNMEQYRLRGAIEGFLPGIPMKVSYNRLVRNLRKRGVKVTHTKLWLAWQQLFSMGVCKPIYEVHGRKHNYYVIVVNPLMLDVGIRRRR